MPENKEIYLLQFIQPSYVINQQNYSVEISRMKALMVNSTSGRVVPEKMRDQMYMKHLREVEKINNRQAENIINDIRKYKSIHELHHKHKSYAFEWHHKVERSTIEQKNKQIKEKISQIRSYFNTKPQRKRGSQKQETSPLRLATLENQDKNPQQSNLQQQTDVFQNNMSSQRKSQQKEQNRHKRQVSLHYRYRKRRQEEIDHENRKLIKAIESQRSSYLPKIGRSRQNNGLQSRSTQKDSQQVHLQTDRL